MRSAKSLAEKSLPPCVNPRRVFELVIINWFFHLLFFVRFLIILIIPSIKSMIIYKLKIHEFTPDIKICFESNENLPHVLRVRIIFLWVFFIFSDLNHS